MGDAAEILQQSLAYLRGNRHILNVILQAYGGRNIDVAEVLDLFDQAIEVFERRGI